MKRKLLIAAVVILAISAIVGIWTFWPQPDLSFRGKPEKEWIGSVKYFDDEQVKEWRAYGPDGVQVLIRGLKRADQPIQEWYRGFWRHHIGQGPTVLWRILPQPHTDTNNSVRMCILSLLQQLGTNADVAMPQVEQMLERNNDGVTELALSYFTDTEGEDGRLNRIPKADKNRLLPKFIRCMGSRDWGVRNNALGCLYYYAEQKQTVGPVLIKALGDTKPDVQIRAAEALKRVDPELFKSSGAVRVPIQILNNPDDQIAHRGARLLRDCNDQSDVALPPLIEALRNTNTLIGCQAVLALENFTDHSAMILPPLREAALRKDIVGGYAKRAVKKLETIEAKRKL